MVNITTFRSSRMASYLSSFLGQLKLNHVLLVRLKIYTGFYWCFYTYPFHSDKYKKNRIYNSDSNYLQKNWIFPPLNAVINKVIFRNGLLIKLHVWFILLSWKKWSIQKNKKIFISSLSLFIAQIELILNASTRAY